MSGRVVHFEIPVDNDSRAREFYSQAFGWQVMEVPNVGYNVAVTGPTTEQTGPTVPGFINGGLLDRGVGAVKQPVITIGVDSVDEALAAVEKAGGKTITTREPVGDLGFSAYFADPEGNILGLWESK
ncbi:VOC family protein [Actinocrispum sp. NPDC049592]|uniref:VOC family protein n=1 Tax=Actinocrispum sp. NPDC049592 TaxID=3154835 RepID=UPI00343EA462